MNKQITDIVYSQLCGETILPEEKKLLDEWLDIPNNRKEYEHLSKLRDRFEIETRINIADENIAWSKFQKNITVDIKNHNRFRKVLAYVAGIMIPLLLISGMIYISEYKDKGQIAKKEDIVKYEREQTTLTLATGEVLVLNKDKEIELKERRGDSFVDSDKSMLSYDKINKKSLPLEESFERIYVPRGGDFILTLSDGTKVWLNSDTELRFPVKFKGNERKVFLKGEAYFEVTHDNKKPFIVASERQYVRVYGTSFNVKDYSEEDFVYTTLVEGSVKVYEGDSAFSRFIKPGEQLINGKGKHTVRNVDVERYISWKDGELNFIQERFENIMMEIARCYDIEIFYLNPAVKDYLFTAWFDKDRGIDYVVKKLKETQSIDVRKKNRTLIISEKKE